MKKMSILFILMSVWTLELHAKSALYYLGGVDDNFNFKNSVYKSTDGRNFPLLGHVLPVSLMEPYGFSFNKKIWLLGGKTGFTTCSRVVYSSPDGLSWTDHGVVLPKTIFTGPSAIFQNKMWLISGVDNCSNNNRSTDVYTSPDGLNWSLHPEPFPVGLFSASAVKFKGRLWVLGGDVAVTRTHNKVYAFNGSTWLDSSHPSVSDLPVPLKDMVAYVKGGRLYVAGGYNGTASVDTIYSTKNGVTWTLETQKLPTAISSARVVKFKGRFYIVGGIDASGVRTEILRSQDGLNWSVVGQLAEERALGAFLKHKSK